MEATKTRARKINSTMKIFLVCFIVYFVCYTSSK